MAIIWSVMGEVRRISRLIVKYAQVVNYDQYRSFYGRLGLSYVGLVYGYLDLENPESMDILAGGKCMIGLSM